MLISMKLASKYFNMITIITKYKGFKKRGAFNCRNHGKK